MLFMLGTVVFDVSPLNTDQVDHTTGADFAEKAVMGRRPPLEFTGSAAEEMTLQGKLFPSHLGGLDELDTLQQLQSTGQPQHLIRGDGKPLGWFNIEKIHDVSRFLNAHGVGKVIDFEISLRRADAPAALDHQGAQLGLVA